MTMSRETNSREALNRRRALASVKAAVDRTSVAINNQIAVLADLRLKIREIDQVRSHCPQVLLYFELILTYVCLSFPLKLAR